MKQLSVQAKPFQPKRVNGHLVSWNILSDTLTESIQHSVSSSPSTPLFTAKFLKKRSEYILHRLGVFIKQYRYPIFCLQEVNDSVDEDRCLMRIIKRFLQDKNYRVLGASYGTFDPIYPELGLITAIPVHLYDVVTFTIQQIDVSAPNVFLYTHLRTKGEVLRDLQIVNTHFPAKHLDVRFMKKYTKTFMEYWHGYRNLLVCGDFNTTYDNEWYPTFEKEWRTLKFPNHITHVSIQRRDRRFTKNTIYQAFIDHVFWTPSSLLVSFVELPAMAIPESEFKLLEQPDRNDVNILPSVDNPSDHYPLVVHFQVLL